MYLVRLRGASSEGDGRLCWQSVFSSGNSNSRGNSDSYSNSSRGTEVNIVSMCVYCYRF